MNILKITNGSAQLCKDKNTEYSVYKISRDQLVELFINVYDDSDYYNFNMNDLEKVKNPVEKEIAKQLLGKIKEFSDNSDDLKKQFNDKFPELS